MPELLRCLLIALLLSLATANGASRQVVNVLTWSSEIPSAVIAQFERETGIKVNCSTFDSN